MGSASSFRRAGTRKPPQDPYQTQRASPEEPVTSLGSFLPVRLSNSATSWQQELDETDRELHAQLGQEDLLASTRTPTEQALMRLRVLHRVVSTSSPGSMLESELEGCIQLLESSTIQSTGSDIDWMQEVMRLNETQHNSQRTVRNSQTSIPEDHSKDSIVDDSSRTQAGRICGMTDLCEAVTNRNTECLRELVSCNANVNEGDADKRTALHFAACEGLFDVVKFLVSELRADVDPVDNFGVTPFDDATRHGHRHVADLLKRSGAGAKRSVLKVCVDEGHSSSVLIDAATRGNVELFRKLAHEPGADANGFDEEKRTAMHLAASGNMLEMVKCLVEEFDVNMSPVDRYGNTPLDNAARVGHTLVAAYLESKGAVTGAKRHTDYASKQLSDAASQGDLDRIRKLVQELGIDINLGDHYKRTAIHLAASEGLLSVVTLLVEELDADLNIMDRWGGTPLDDAIRAGHELVTNYLESKGGVRGFCLVGSAGNHALCEAALRGDVDLVRSLVKNDSLDVNHCDDEQRTALHLAASKGHLDVVECLVDDLGADFELVDSMGCTALDHAMLSKHELVVSFLELSGARKGSAPSNRCASTSFARTGSKCALANAALDPASSPSAASGPATRAQLATAIEEWSFDTLGLEEACGHALPLLGQEVLERHGLVQACRLDEDVLRNFLLKIESDYGSNPFHTSVHGADVMVFTRLFLSKFGLVKRLSRLQLLAAFVGSMVHDFNHPGTTNLHEVSMQSPLAITHSDQSVLERHHLAAAFKVLNTKGFNIFKSLSNEDYKAVRSVMVELILHTDLSKHFDFIARLNTLSNKKGHYICQSLALCKPGTWTTPFLDESTVDAKLLLNASIKFADIGHVLKPYHLHKIWTQRVTEEFWELGDKEKALRMAVSPLCDRVRDRNIAKSQIGFFNFICAPFYKVIADVIDPEMEPYLQFQENLRQWQHQNRSTNRPATGEGGAITRNAALAVCRETTLRESEPAFGKRRSM